MEENEGKNLAQDMKKDEELLNKIRELQNKKREERQNENIDIKYYENCELKLGKNAYPLKVSVAEITEKMLEGNQNEDEIVTYDIYMKYDGQDVLIANIDEQGKLIINREELEKIDPENKLGLLELGEDEKPDISALKELDGKTEKELEKHKEDREKETEETAKDDNEEKETEEKEDKEKNRDEEKEEIAKKYNLKASQVVHIDMTDEK